MGSTDMRVPARRKAIAGTAIAVALVASTVALIAFMGPGPSSIDPPLFGIIVSRDGPDWQLAVARVPSGMAYTSTTLTLLRQDRSTNLSATPWIDLDFAENGCSLRSVNPAANAVSVGDRVLCRVSWYAEGTRYLLLDRGNAIAIGELR